MSNITEITINEKEIDNESNSNNIEKSPENEDNQEGKENIGEKSTEEIRNELDNMPFEVLKEDYPEYDLSFKVIVIGDSGI